ncbi:hypothetical protein [Gordonia sp. NPDC127522]|uniref:hypothetical protein n=1 Tax=Gordonia sp. NPDC127522 TaxID=3345390 RepID=UPI00362543C8
MSAVSDNTIHRRFAAASLLAVVTAAGLAGCSTPDRVEPQGPSSVAPQPFSTPPTVSWPFAPPTSPTQANAPTKLPAGVSVDRSSADSVALAATRIWYGWDTTRDRSPYDAALRAAPLMAEECRTRLTATPPTGSPGNYWTQLALVHATAQLGPGDVRFGFEDRPPDTDARAVRIVTVTQRFRADRPVPPRRYVVTVQLTARAGQWSLGNPDTDQCGVRPR